jgi:4-hydroxy-tetrahydrodipicolinate synthase
MNTFTGTGVALGTAFNIVGSIDWNGLKNLIEHCIAGGVDYLVVQGTTGESATTTEIEKQKILDFIVEKNKGRKPIVFGLGGNNTQGILEQIKILDLRHVDGLLSVSPYYNKPSQEGIYQHYLHIAGATDLPIILYNVPGRTSSNIQAATTLRLAEITNIIGVKEASGNMEQCMQIIKGKPDDFLLISGDDLLTVPMISIGAEGVISVLANAFPSDFTTMVSKALSGDFKQAASQLMKFTEINSLMYEESNPVGVKQALSHLGVCGPDVRLPLMKASESLAKRIKEAMG